MIWMLMAIDDDKGESVPIVSIKILGKEPAVTAQENQFRRALNPDLLAGVQAELKKWDHQKNSC